MECKESLLPEGCTIMNTSFSVNNTLLFTMEHWLPLVKDEERGKER